MIAFRHVDPRFPFLWETPDQPPGRWHGQGEGPVNTFADTPDGAWAEFIRHEGIVDPADLDGLRRSIWAVEVGTFPTARPRLAAGVLAGGSDTYQRCRRAAARLRARREPGLVAPSAALAKGEAAGWHVRGGPKRARARDGLTIALFGARPDLEGWEVVRAGRPADEVVTRARQLSG